MFSWIWNTPEEKCGKAPIFTEHLQSQQVNHGEKVILEAKLTGIPLPIIVWYHGKDEIIDSPDFSCTYDVSSGIVKLTIDEIFLDDQGSYRAIAVNEHGRDETSAFVGVEDIEVVESDDARFAPRIISPLKSNVLSALASVDFTVEFEAFPPPIVKWYCEEKEIHSGEQYLISNGYDNSILHIEELYEEDAGEYEVRIFNDVGEARSAASLIVTEMDSFTDLKPPQFIKPLGPQIIPEGEAAIMGVEVQAVPEATFSWFKHGTKLTDDDELEISIQNDGNISRLVLGEVFDDDSGEYSVAAENCVGRASSSATLIVEPDHERDRKCIPPEFVEHIKPIKAMDGQNIKFEGFIKGIPTPDITWFHAGKPIGHHREVKALQNRAGNIGLAINEVFPEDSGDYSCVAKNSAGEARSIASLIVEEYEYIQDFEVTTVSSTTEKTLEAENTTDDEILGLDQDSDSDLSEIGSSPEFVETLPLETTIDEGKPIRMLARVAGYPRPTVSWNLNGNPIKVSETISVSHYEDGTVSLSLMVTDDSISGEYSCEAQNRNGIATTATNLVLNAPKHNEETSSAYRKPDWVIRMEELKHSIQAEHVAPEFTRNLKDGEVKEMENFVFNVTFKGNPKPEISWYHNNLLIHQQQAYQMRVRGDKAVLTLVEASPKHKGEYVCRAVNSAGEEISKSTLQVVELSYEEKLKIENERYAALSIQHAAEHMKLKEKERNEKQKIAHKEAMERMREERIERRESTTKKLEEVKNPWGTPLKKVFDSTPKQKGPEPQTPKELRIAQVYSNWKAPVALEEAYPVVEPEEFSPNQIPGVKCFVKVSDTSLKGEEVVKEIAPKYFEDKQVIIELAKVHSLLKSSVKINEIWSMFRAGEFPALQQPSIQSALVKICEFIGHQRNVSIVLAEEIKLQAEQHPVGLKAFIRMLQHANNIKHDVLFKEVIPKEMGKWSSTTVELQKVSQMLNQGIETEVIIASCEAGDLPSLKKPETQQPLVNIVEKQGHSVMVAQVLVEEAYRDAKTASFTEVSGKTTEHISQTTQVVKVTKKTSAYTKEMAPGMKAYVEMAVEKSVNITEVVNRSRLQQQAKQEMLKVGTMIKEGIQSQEVFDMLEHGDFPQLMKEEVQLELLDVVDDCGYKAIVNSVMIDEAAHQVGKSLGAKAVIYMLNEASINIDEFINEAMPREFGADSTESKEVAKISVMLKEGVQVEEIVTMMEADQLPMLKKPECQAPLLKIVEDHGQRALVCHLLIEESVKEIKKGLPKADVAEVSSEPSLRRASQAEVIVKEHIQTKESRISVLKSVTTEEVQVGQLLRAISTYVTEQEHENSMHLVEGERLYLLENINSDWWFVEKTLTKERGYVPAKLMSLDVSYTHYVKEKMDDKIEKLPVFEKLKKGQKSDQPRISKILESQSAVDGTEVQLVAKVEGVPRPNVTWFRETAIIKPSEEFQVFYAEDNTATLLIKEVFPEDAGLFTCVAKNVAGYATTSAELIVEGPMSDHGSEATLTSRRSLSRESSVCDIMEGIPPTFAAKTITKMCEENSQFEVDVRLVAIPEPEIIWKRDGQVIKDSQRIRIIRQKDVHAYRSTILIKGTSKEDGGVYEVFAKNREGDARCFINLNITAPEGPVFKEKFTDTTVEEAGTMRLVARITGVPTPEISWSRDGKKIKPGKDVTAKYADEIAVLEVQNITSTSDAGKYTCTATNRIGKATHSAVITIGSDVVSFKRGLESCVVEENSEIILECRTSKERDVKWWKGKTVIKSSVRIIIEKESLTHRLVIHSSSPNDAGKYKCTFEDQSTWCNVKVKANEEFTDKLRDLEVQEKDEVVLYVEVSSENSHVSWHKDGEELVNSDRLKIIADGLGRSLNIPVSSLSDEGEYTCVLNDIETTCELTVRELPAEIIKRMTDQKVKKSEKACFSVELSKGDAVITWFKNDKEIKVSDHYQLSIDGKIQRLTIYNSQPEDVGVYRAVVGKTDCTAKLQVEVDKEFVKGLPGNMDAVTNTDVTFTVEVSKKDCRVQWFRNDKEIKSSKKYVIEEANVSRTLIIKNVDTTDSSVYSCTIEKRSTKCNLSVLVIESAPQIDRSSIKTEYIVGKGSEVTFTVPFKGTPTPTATWFFKGKEISKSKKVLPSVKENVASFTLYQVSTEECGEYTLRLSNSCGDVSIDFTLKILDKPSAPGAPAALEVGNDSLTLLWKAPEEDGGRVIIKYILQYTLKRETKWITYEETITKNTTIVKRLTKDEEYSFRVSAVNEIGTSEYSIQSQFIKVCKPIHPEPPKIKENLEPVIAGARQTIVLRCVITGHPVPELTWRKDDTVITSKQHTTYENFTATLTLNDTTEHTTGLYSCSAVNSAGSAQTSASVVIQEAPSFEFAAEYQVQRLTVGDKWRVPVQVRGVPTPLIVWGCNDRPIKDFPRVIVHTEASEGMTDLAIQKLSLEDSGVFSLTASNSAGKASLSFNLRVDKKKLVVKEIEKERPAAPGGPLDISEITTSSVTLSWKASESDGGSDITSYYIEKLEKGQKQWQKVAEVQPTIFSYTVQNLSEGREYYFRVFALNSIGMSDSLEASQTIFIKSNFSPPSAPLGPFDVTDMKETSLVLHWDEPLEDGGSVITQYILERRTAMKKAWQKMGTTMGEVTHFECTKLKKGYSYFFRVFAVNIAGQGPPLQPDEPITAGKKLSVPSKPNGLSVIDITSKTVTLAWSPPSTTGGVDLIGYVIEKRLTESGSQWERVDKVDSSVTLYCVESLREQSEYEFRIFAENPVGMSEEAAVTERVILKTHATPPSPPTAPLEARTTGPTSLMIEWGAPESDGGSPLLGYIIAIRDIKRTMWIEVGQVDANFTRLHIKEVQEEHEYNVRVFARNEVGASEPLGTEEPIKIIKPDDYQEIQKEDAAPSLSYSTTETLSWMREAGVDADIYSYARGRLLNRDEYFFKVWHQTQQIHQQGEQPPE